MSYETTGVGFTSPEMGHNFTVIQKAFWRDWFCVLLSHVQVFATLWTVAQQAPQSMGFSRQEYWSGLSYLPPEDLLDPGIKPASLTSPALAGRFFTISTTWEAQFQVNFLQSLNMVNFCSSSDRSYYSLCPIVSISNR